KVESLVSKAKDELSETLMGKLVPALKGEKGKMEAEFHVILVPGTSRNAQVAGVKFIRGDEKLHPLQAALKSASYRLIFPGETTAKLIRRVIVTCQNGECSFALLPPEDVTSVD